MKLSIVVPIYNAQAYLCECIDSILAQTFTDFELILVNDGSNDKSLSIANDYAKKEKRIKVIDKENGGVSSARNVGIENSSGKYIGFVDSDDYIEPTMYDDLINAIEQNDADIAICSVDIPNSSHTYGQEYPKGVFTFENASKEWKQKYFGGNIETFSVNKLYKRKIFDEIKFPEFPIMEDRLLWCYIFQKHYRFISIDKVLYHYRVVGNSAVRSYHKERYDVSVLVFKEDKKLGGNAYKEEIYGQFLGCICNCINQEAGNNERKKNVLKIKNSKYFDEAMSNKSCNTNVRLPVQYLNDSKYIMLEFYWIKLKVTNYLRLIAKKILKGN